jgi:hypothetical protein
MSERIPTSNSSLFERFWAKAVDISNVNRIAKHTLIEIIFLFMVIFPFSFYTDGMKQNPSRG